MWVFCGGMSRSGSTLQFQLTAHIVESVNLGKRIGWIEPGEFEDLRRRDDVGKEWRVVKTHICTPSMIEEFEAGRAKGIYVFRDIRAVVVSAMRQFSKTYDTLINERFVDAKLGTLSLGKLPRLGFSIAI